MSDTGTISNHTIAQAISRALHNAVGGFPSGAKVIARRVQRNPRAARNWLDGANAPRAAEIIELMREFDEVYEEVLRLAERRPPDSDGDLNQRIQQAMHILSGEKNEINHHRVSQMGTGRMDQR